MKGLLRCFLFLIVYHIKKGFYTLILQVNLNCNVPDRIIRSDQNDGLFASLGVFLLLQIVSIMFIPYPAEE